MAAPAYPSGVLTVIFRDDAPLIHCGDAPSYRSVRIQLTAEQIAQLAMRHTHSSGSNDYHEEISRCFLEPKEA